MHKKSDTTKLSFLTVLMSQGVRILNIFKYEPDVGHSKDIFGLRSYAEIEDFVVHTSRKVSKFQFEW